MYNEFIKLTEDIFTSLSGYWLVKQKDKNIFKFETQRKFVKNTSKEEVMVQFRDALSNYLFKGEDFIFIGDFAWDKKKEWILGLANLNPTPEQISRIYEGLFQTISLSAITHLLPTERSDPLLPILYSQQLPKYEGRSVGFSNLHNLEHTIDNIAKHWKNIPEDKLEPAIKALLQSYEPLLLTDNNKNSEKIICAIQKIFKDPLSFLPYLPALPQKNANNKELFSNQDNGVAQFRLIHSTLFSQYPKIMTYPEATKIIDDTIGYINQIEPGNISNIRKLENNQEYTRLLVESKTQEIPDIASVKKVIEQTFNLYIEDNFQHRFDNDFWKRAVDSFYLESKLPDKKVVSIKNKI